METQFIFTDYIDHLMAQAVYDKLDDGTYSGRISQYTDVVAFGTTLHECEDKLRPNLEDCILLSFKIGQPLPVEVL